MTLKIGNKHLLFQTRVREFQQEQAVTVWVHFLGLIPTGKHSLRVWFPPTTSLLQVFHTGLSHICQIKTKTVPYNFPPFFLFVRAVVVVNPTRLATCRSLLQRWANNQQMHRNIQSMIRISKQPPAPVTHNLRLSPSNQFLGSSQPRVSWNV